MKLAIGLVGVMACFGLAAVAIAASRDHPGTSRPVAHVSSTPTPAAGTSAAPMATATRAAGIYWACETDVTASGLVEPSLDPGIEAQGGAVSPICEQALQIEGVLKPGSGGRAFQVPVGHFAPFHFCGVTVANIVNVVPGKSDVPPSQWIAADYELYSADWSQSAPSGTC
ncbi:MAG: hypothetical protein J2P38_05660 [Candidatus Dormibacteraeota bacterium]|nr:hypothetical protein [Candidatus Dormibacteraeota bacterium]